MEMKLSGHFQALDAGHKLLQVLKEAFLALLVDC